MSEVACLDRKPNERIEKSTRSRYNALSNAVATAAACAAVRGVAAARRTIQECRRAPMPHQERSDEYWDVYDAERRATGRLHRRGDPLGPGDYHLVAEVWTIDLSGRVLLTKRHPSISWGGLWACTGGCAVAGEDSRAAAVRASRRIWCRTQWWWSWAARRRSAVPEIPCVRRTCALPYVPRAGRQR